MSDSDEAPDQVSFKTAKIAVEKERNLVYVQKQNDKRIAKLKRKIQQEVFMLQKLDKVKKHRQRDQLFSDNILDDLREEMAMNNTSLSTEPVKPVSIIDKPKPKPKKVYRDLNIEVMTLSGVKTDRAMAATAFRDKRLAKTHRESVSVNLVHAEKLAAAGK